jgi:hypothetical protein
MSHVGTRKVIAGFASAKGFPLSDEDLDELVPWFIDFQLRLEKLWTADLDGVWQREAELVVSPSPISGRKASISGREA